LKNWFSLSAPGAPASTFALSLVSAFMSSHFIQVYKIGSTSFARTSPSFGENLRDRGSAGLIKTAVHQLSGRAPPGIGPEFATDGGVLFAFALPFLRSR
jgi:hypothetical protein